jgi:hypothetical protein
MTPDLWRPHPDPPPARPDRPHAPLDHGTLRQTALLRRHARRGLEGHRLPDDDVRRRDRNLRACRRNQERLVRRLASSYQKRGGGSAAAPKPGRVSSSVKLGGGAFNRFHGSDLAAPPHATNPRCTAGIWKVHGGSTAMACNASDICVRRLMAKTPPHQPSSPPVSLRRKG